MPKSQECLSTVESKLLEFEAETEDYVGFHQGLLDHNPVQEGYHLNLC